MKSGMKRFYREVTLGSGTAGFEILLDGRPVRTPAKAPMTLPSQRLAEAVMAEWQAQDKDINPETMPMTRICCTALDQVSANRAQTVADLAVYGRHDLLCYRCEEPADLAQEQQQLWQPLLDWAALTLDARLQSTNSLCAIEQPPESLAALERWIGRYDDLALAALGQAVTASGSLVIGLALAFGRLDANAAFAASQLDEIYQIRRWGADSELSKRHAGIRAELDSAEAFFRLTGDGHL
jgi:chaperone required for assembly of F1-ATPase